MSLALTEELCPACVYRTQWPGLGWCRPCYDRRLQEEYALADREAAEIRRQRWADRQRRHRAFARMRPLEPLAHDADPLGVGSAAVYVLEKLQKRLRAVTDVAAIDDVIESIKQLAWGEE